MIRIDTSIVKRRTVDHIRNQVCYLLAHHRLSLVLQKTSLHSISSCCQAVLGTLKRKGVSSLHQCSMMHCILVWRLLVRASHPALRLPERHPKVYLRPHREAVLLGMTPPRRNPTWSPKIPSGKIFDVVLVSGWWSACALEGESRASTAFRNVPRLEVVRTCRILLPSLRSLLSTGEWA